MVLTCQIRVRFSTEMKVKKMCPSSYLKWLEGYSRVVKGVYVHLICLSCSSEGLCDGLGSVCLE